MNVQPSSAPSLAFFVSSHGYGHAARAAAVMAELMATIPGCRLSIFTRTPTWFFEDSLPGPFEYYSQQTDIGLVQDSPLQEDLPATIEALDHFLPFDANRIDPLAQQLQRAGCRLVLCDISPLGVAVARAAGIPSVLIENFTWDWIYEGYLDLAPGLQPHIAYLKEVFAQATYHIQTEPVCAHDARASLVTNPVARKPRRSTEEVRRHLGIDGTAPAVMVTMGGIPEQFTFLERLTRFPQYRFVIPGGSERRASRTNLVLLPHHSEFFHPDLIQAADAVVGKAGYSTLAETYRAGAPFGYIGRPRFRESERLAHYIRTHMSGLEITNEHFENGEWAECLPQLLSLPRATRHEPNGADQIAAYLRQLLG